MPAKLNTKEIQRRIDDSDTVNLQLLEEYTNSKAKILVQCCVCETERVSSWSAIQSAIRRGNTC